MSNHFQYYDQNNVAMTGAEAAAEAMRQIEPGVVPVFPITPQTPIIEKFAKLAASGKVKSEIITAESEHSVMSAAIGGAAAGSRSMTATSSVGLALMYEMLNIASGMRLPIVMNVANRALSAPINIHCDHSDAMGVRDAGWLQFYCETAQEAYDYTILAVRLAEHKDILLPVMVNQDGFITSHLLEKLEILADEEVKKFVGEYQYPYSLLSDGEEKLTYGALVLPDYFFETKVAQFTAMEKARKIYKKIASEYATLSGREFPEIETFLVNEDTEAVIITMSAAAGTAKAVAQKMNKKGHKVGVIKVKMFRPFPYEELAAVIKNLPGQRARQGGITKIAVLDRAFSYGSVPALYSETVQALFTKMRDGNQKIQSYVFGLGGRDLREKDVEKVYADLLTDDFSEETKFLNLNS